MTGFLTGRRFNLALRLLLGGLFVFAAWGKIVYPQGFAISVRAYEILPPAISNLFALVVSWSEFIAGVCLLLGIFPRKAASALFLLLLMFTAAIVTTVVRGMVIDCGCFGSEGSANTSWLLVLRNVLLLAAAWIVMRYNDGFLSLLPGRRQPARITESAVR